MGGGGWGWGGKGRKLMLVLSAVSVGSSIASNVGNTHVSLRMAEISLCEDTKVRAFLS